MTKTLFDSVAVGSNHTSASMETKPGQVTHSIQYVTRAAPVPPATEGAVVVGPILVRVVDHAVRAIRVNWITATSTLEIDVTLAEGKTDEWTTVNSVVLVLGLSTTLTVRGYPAN